MDRTGLDTKLFGIWVFRGRVANGERGLTEADPLLGGGHLRSCLSDGSPR